LTSSGIIAQRGSISVWSRLATYLYLYPYLYPCLSISVSILLCIYLYLYTAHLDGLTRSSWLGLTLTPAIGLTRWAHRAVRNRGRLELTISISKSLDLDLNLYSCSPSLGPSIYLCIILFIDSYTSSHLDQQWHHRTERIDIRLKPPCNGIALWLGQRALCPLKQWANLGRRGDMAWVHIYINTHKYIHTYIDTHTHTYLSIYLSISISIYLSIYLYISSARWARSSNERTWGEKRRQRINK